LSKVLLSRELTAPDVENPAIAIGIVAVWRWVSLWSEYYFGSPSLTIAWSLLGLVAFLLGMLFRTPMYRTMGALLVVAAMIRAGVVDPHRAGMWRTTLNLSVIGAVILIAVFFRSAFPARDAENINGDQF